MYREQYGEYADWFWVRKGWCVWNSLTMGSEVQRISETTVWTKLIKIFYRNNFSSSISFVQKSLFFPPIVCVVFFSPEEKQPMIKNKKFVTHQRYCKWGWSTNPKTGAANEQPTRASCKTVLAWNNEGKFNNKQRLLHYDTNLSWLVIKQMEPSD